MTRATLRPYVEGGASPRPDTTRQTAIKTLPALFISCNINYACISTLISVYNGQTEMKTTTNVLFLYIVTKECYVKYFVDFKLRRSAETSEAHVVSDSQHFFFSTPNGTKTSGAGTKRLARLCKKLVCISLRHRFYIDASD